MKSALLSLTLVVVLASCTTAYKAAQTPDDVYYSPARPHVASDEYVSRNDRNDQYSYNEQNDDDRYLRMKVHNRRTWSDLDYYYNDPLAYNYYSPFNTYGSIYYNTPWNYYSSWNYYYNPYSTYYGSNYYNPYYNPYGSKVVIVNPRPPVYNRPRTFNLNVYNPPVRANSAYNYHSNGTRRVYGGDNRNFNYNNRNSYNSNNNSGSSLRNIFSNNNNSSSNNSFSRPSNNASSSSSSPSRSSGSTNAPVRKF
jgi:hypothetical protein